MTKARVSNGFASIRNKLFNTKGLAGICLQIQSGLLYNLDVPINHQHEMSFVRRKLNAAEFGICSANYLGEKI